MPDAPRSVTLDDLVQFPLPGLDTPSQLSFTDEGRTLTWLFSPEGTLTRQLFAVDVATGASRLAFTPPGKGEQEETLSLEEQLRRERLRERGLGVTRYAWSADGGVMMVPLGGKVMLKDGLDGPARELVQDVGDPQLSHDGQQLCFTRDGELHVMPTAGGDSVQVSSGAAGRTRGHAEFVAQEEMGRMHGAWWSLDSQRLAFTEVDDAVLPAFRIAHLGAVDPFQEEVHHYPFAGAANSTVGLGVVSRAGGAVTWMQLPDWMADGYLARVGWGIGDQLWVQLQDRAQSRLELWRFDASTGRGERVLVETSEVWINLHRMFLPLSDGGFIWGSERSGFLHLYRYSADGALQTTLTRGPWLVDELVEVHEASGQLWFMASQEHATQRQLYRVRLDGTGLVRVTQGPGLHAVVLDRARGVFVDLYSPLDQPPTLTLCSLQSGEPLHELFRSRDPRLAELDLSPPELVSLRTRDGVELHGAVYRPQGPGPFPVAVSVYGGPHAQRVQRGWHMSTDMRAQHLRSQGILVFKLDNRGSARRGLAFEGALRHNMGEIEVQDQVDGVRWLVQQGLADPKRVAIYGWSYGGYMSAMALARAPDTFCAGVAGAPVTHWDAYDTHYTERYMGTPQGNPDGYERSSVMAHVQSMRGALLLVHGLIDENVHFRHTARLINALVQHDKRYQLLLFPDERHMPRGAADRRYLEARIADFLTAELSPEGA